MEYTKWAYCARILGVLALGTMALAASCSGRAPEGGDTAEQEGSTAISNLEIGSAERGEDGVLSLRLESVKATFDAGDPIELRVWVENNDTGYWVLPPRFFPDGQNDPRFPLFELRFEVLNEFGVSMTHVGVLRESGLRRAPSLCRFVLLAPDHFVGGYFQIDDGPYGYRLTGSGEYTVRAILTSLAGEWTRQRLSAGEAPAECTVFSPERVYDGKITSNSIVISYKEAK